MIRIGHADTMIQGPFDPPSGGDGGMLPPGTGPLSNEAYAIWQIQQLLAQYPGAEIVGDGTKVKMPNGRIRTFERNDDGTPKLSSEWDVTASRNYLASLGSGGGSSGGGGGRSGGSGSGGGGVTDDPRYWANQQAQTDLDWAKLSSDEKQQAEAIRAQLINAGLDAETARRQALASLIQSRNSNSIDLANTSANVAKTAAEFAANPRDAIAELQYRNATGVGPAFGAIGNTQFGGYQSKLDDKFQNLFGGVAGDLSRAREYVNSIPPTEFFGAETRQQLGLPLLPQQEMLQPAPPAPNPLDALTQKLQAMSPQDKEAFRRYTDPVYRERQTNIENAYKTDPKAAEEFFRKLTEMNQGVVPTRAEDGVNMNIHEPAAVVGMSGRVYATMAENDPEQLRVIPLPSVKKYRAELEKKQKEREKSGASVRDGDAFHSARMQFLEQTRGAQRMATGGTVTNPYGREIRGLTGAIGEGAKSAGRRGPGTGYDIAQRMRAGKFNWDFLGGRNSRGRYRGRIDAPTAANGALGGLAKRTPAGMPIPTGDTQSRGGIPAPRMPGGMPIPNDTGLGTGADRPNSQTNPVLNDFMGNIRQQLSMLGVGTPGGQTLPDPRFLANGVLSNNENDPVLQAYIEAAYSRLGIDPRTLWATASQYRPTGLNTGGGVPSVRFV